MGGQALAIRAAPAIGTDSVTTFRPALDEQLQGYLDHLTIERGVAANTLSSYRRDLRRYSEHLVLRGIDDLSKVTETDVSDFLVALRRGDPDAGTAALSAVSAARALIAVRGFHRFAAAEGITDVDVARGVRPDVDHYTPTTAHTAAMCLISGPGVVTSIAVPESVSQASDLVFLKVTAGPGDVMRRPPDGNSVAGYLVAQGDSFDQAMATATRLADQIQIQLAA